VSEQFQKKGGVGRKRGKGKKLERGGEAFAARLGKGPHMESI